MIFVPLIVADGRIVGEGKVKLSVTGIVAGLVCKGLDGQIDILDLGGGDEGVAKLPLLQQVPVGALGDIPADAVHVSDALLILAVPTGGALNLRPGSLVGWSRCWSGKCNHQG